jgi:hypothetical protein
MHFKTKAEKGFVLCLHTLQINKRGRQLGNVKHKFLFILESRVLKK